MSKFKKFFKCNKTWIGIGIIISMLIYNFLTPYHATQFTVMVNLIVGALVGAGVLNDKCNIDKDKTDKRKLFRKHRK